MRPCPVDPTRLVGIDRTESPPARPWHAPAAPPRAQPRSIDRPPPAPPGSIRRSAPHPSLPRSVPVRARARACISSSTGQQEAKLCARRDRWAGRVRVGAVIDLKMLSGRDRARTDRLEMPKWGTATGTGTVRDTVSGHGWLAGRWTPLPSRRDAADCCSCRRRNQEWIDPS